MIKKIVGSLSHPLSFVSAQVALVAPTFLSAVLSQTVYLHLQEHDPATRVDNAESPD